MTRMLPTSRLIITPTIQNEALALSGAAIGELSARTGGMIPMATMIATRKTSPAAPSSLRCQMAELIIANHLLRIVTWQVILCSASPTRSFLA